MAGIIGCGSSKNTTDSTALENQEQAETISQPDTILSNEPKADLDKALRDSLTQIYKDELFTTNQSKANRITTFYILAQQKFYNGEYQEALFLINQAIRVKETADVFALKGSIYLGLGSTENFITFWRRALDLDSNVPIPPSPAIVAELKKHGLINDNPDRNF